MTGEDRSHDRLMRLATYAATGTAAAIIRRVLTNFWGTRGWRLGPSARAAARSTPFDVIEPISLPGAGSTCSGAQRCTAPTVACCLPLERRLPMLPLVC